MAFSRIADDILGLPSTCW